jgi:hypothetical protein
MGSFVVTNVHQATKQVKLHLYWSLAVDQVQQQDTSERIHIGFVVFCVKGIHVL